MTFTWTFALALPAELLAQGTAPKKAPQSASQPLAAWKPGKRIAPPASLKENLKPLSLAQLAKINATPSHRMSTSLTSLDEVGKLKRPVSDAKIAQWKSEIHTAAASKSELAKSHLLLGEYRLAHDEQPEDALSHFRQAMKLVLKERNSPASAEIIGTAKHDIGFGLFCAGKYAQSAAALQSLLTTTAHTKSKLRNLKTFPLTGFARKDFEA